jgi:hypothetical protein
MTASVKIEGKAHLLNRCKRAPAVVLPPQVEYSSKPGDRFFVKSEVGLEFCVRERSQWIQPAVDHRRIPRSHASLSVSARKEFKILKIAKKSGRSHDGMCPRWWQ